MLWIIAEKYLWKEEYFGVLTCL